MSDCPTCKVPQRVVLISYLFGDILLLAVAVRLWRTGGPAHRLPAATFGLLALLAVDTLYGLSVLTTASRSGAARPRLDPVLRRPGRGRPVPVDGVAVEQAPPSPA